MRSNAAQYIMLSLYLLALINPISKVFFLSSIVKGRDHFRKTTSLAVRSSVIALIILFLFTIAGNIILTKLFHVEIYSFKILGGIVLFTMGYRALSKGAFFETDESTKLLDLAIIPLASPLIAGPATITGVISFSAQYGILPTSLAMVIAVAVNCVIMLFSGIISRLLAYYHLIGALIRITGLIVSTMAVQMICDGGAAWYHSLTH
ncbi:MAG: MarC family protein [Spirochaetota bacterium]